MILENSWALENWCFWIPVLEKALESLWDCKEIKAVNLKGNQPWIFIGRTDAEAETPILCPPYAKSRVIRKDHDAGKDWRQVDTGMTEDEMVGWHHWLGHVFEQALGESEGQRSLACCSPWGCKESDTTEQLNNRKHLLWLKYLLHIKIFSICASSYIPKYWTCITIFNPRDSRYSSDISFQISQIY